MPWLGEIPTHWEVRRNGRLFGPRRENGFPNLPVLEVSIRNGVRVRDFGSGRKQEMSDRAKYQRAVRGDVAYNMMRMWQGAVGVAPVDGLVSPAYVVARPFADTSATYYAYLFRTAAYMRETDVFSRGIVPDRNRLYWEAFKQMPSAYPPLNEQHLIVLFLDWHGAHSAKLVRAKRRLIALLNEQKQAIIHQAVTRGLDPDAQFKPSGFSWLGKVPAHWSVGRLKSICQINPSQISLRKRASSELATFLPMERVGTDGSFDASLRKPISEIQAGLTYFERGDVLLAKITPCFENGKGAALDLLPSEVGFGSTEFFVLRASKQVNSQYLYLLTSQSQFRLLGVESMTGSAGQQRISRAFVADYLVALPGLEEQTRIIEVANQVNNETEVAISLAKREIALIQEFQIRLISDVVTGKLDVRAVAASLPETSELEPAAELAEDENAGDVVEDIEDEELAA